MEKSKLGHDQSPIDNDSPKKNKKINKRKDTKTIYNVCTNEAKQQMCNKVTLKQLIQCMGTPMDCFCEL